ncbi:MAG: acetyl-CoA acetyltransferase [Alphaproteobacteria bacterium]
MTACIVGWHHTPFGKHENATIESLLTEATQGALAHAGVEGKDIDQIMVGHFNHGFSNQGFAASLPLNADDSLRFTPSTRVENACATGSAAIHQAAALIEAKLARIVLVVGGEVMTQTPGPEIGVNLQKASYVVEEGDTPGGFAGVFGRIADGYFQTYGDQTDALAMIAAKNHKAGCNNPLAQMQRDFGYEFCRFESDKNPRVAGPLKRTDCSLVSDGAAAVVMCDVETALQMEQATILRGRAQVNDFLPMSRRDMTYLEGCAEAWRQVHERAGTTVDSLDLAETHDCFTIAELMQVEAMGMAARGKGAEVVSAGDTDRGGRLPLNMSGGLKAKGHPIGATGISMHIMASRQVLGEADDMQVEGAQLAGVFNMGGAGVANFCSIVEALR